MEDIETETIKYFYATSASISPFIVGVLFLNFVYLFLRMPFHSFMFHLHLLLFCGCFILKIAIYFVQPFLKSYLFWTSQTLLYCGLTYTIYSIVYIFFTQSNKKKYVNSVILPGGVFYFMFVVMVHSLWYEWATTIMLVYTALFCTILMIVILLFIFFVRSFGSKRVVLFVDIILFIVTFILFIDIISCIASAIILYPGCFIHPLVDLINSLLITSLVVILTDGLLFFRAFSGYKGILVDEENTLVTTKTSIDIEFLLHRQTIKQTEHSVVGSTIFLGKTVSYKQVALEELLNQKTLNDDLIKLKSLHHPNIQQTEGISITNLNVYVIYNHHFLPSMESIFETKDTFNDYQIIQIMKGLTSALLELQDEGILHFHFSLSNILVNESMDKVIIVDFLPYMKWWFTTENGELPSTLMFESEDFIASHKQYIINLVHWIFYRMIIGKNATKDIILDNIPQSSLFYSTLKRWVNESSFIGINAMSNDIASLKHRMLVEDEEVFEHHNEVKETHHLEQEELDENGIIVNE
ncbi:hypothetical protein CL6EHI_158160 [Entamoeba histolytica]|uniref:Protein kinase domain-containing protein n=4 Tax=Entamoeba histolytica TaxID=5759 RepID=C4M2D5_ENTH1|nr:hypothetical protein EHI_158160 [Entamoeba histolytica HM-1:IMSS]EAL45427.1 hypothetical protein EHI_158160 [Entamoeba histolytica HM-1:IMSS]EMD48574.1 Hypothetical protein EHI5A_007540 [Entamoeba histolytica KU27]ENY60937.1 hypothetical protein EHI7A_002980 [Entamoeba histolytica HM-1:IMSS-A]GAT95437.1 hypothetical protein CL6EHI_158160 [Entamoeba histolytica]|eukprot:XP_650813.1 hypothetical protein EHI_158160 [Entamoeba histolytica HM-1:IMSS]